MSTPDVNPPPPSLEAVLVSGAEAAAVRRFLLEVGVGEKHWPVEDLRALLARDGDLIGVFREEEVIGAAQILYERPYPVVEAFPGCVAADITVPCEVTLIAVDRGYRRSAPDAGVAALDALVKAVYRRCLAGGVTHILTLFEEWTIRIFDDHVRIPVRRLADGAHYWCGTDAHGPLCNLTFPCALDMQAGERRWQTERPEFWEYLQEDPNRSTPTSDAGAPRRLKRKRGSMTCPK
jgi:hypothetical protein